MVRRPYPADFNPRSPCGERRKWGLRHGHHQNFNPRSPCGERLAVGAQPGTILRFQSTLPLRGATDAVSHEGAVLVISIHAPLAGSDGIARRFHDLRNISIHAPLAGSDSQSTTTQATHYNFNPRSPCGERLHKWTSKVHRMRQYLIHALESISSSPHIHFKMTCNQVLYF